MINVNQITSQLARMPDQALQQYAMMHKNDPYTVSLALSESNRRKQMRDAAQGQQGMAPQPKVVDQGIAGMAAPSEMNPAQMEALMQQLDRKKEQEYREFTRGAAPAPQPMPEDVGIGALPAPNMQGMAGGGIVAFGGGGDVPGYAPGGTLIDRMQAQGVAALRPLQDQINQAEQIYVAAAKSGDPAAISRYGKVLSDLKAQLAEKTSTQFGNAAPAVMAQLTPAAVAPAAVAPAVVIPSVNPPVAPPAPAPTDRVPPAPGAGKPRPAPAPAAAAPRAPVVPDGDYLTQLDAMEARAGDVVDPTALLKQNQTLKEVQAEKAALDERKLEQKAEFDEMFKGKEERIGKREAELGKSKDTNTGMAFLEAGLAMMQARGPGLAGIAQGAGVGLKQYQSGIKDIRAAQEKLDDARDRIEELRQNQSSMNKREVRDAEKGIRAIVNQGDRSLIEGVEKATGVRQAKFSAAVTSNMARAEAERNRNFQAEQGGLDRASREKIASMPPAEIQKISLLGGGDFAKGYEIYKQEAAIPRLYESYTKMASDPLKGAEFQAKYPTFETYRAGMGTGKGGAILDIPDAAAGAVRTR
jgi:hypothetical protein